MKNMLLIKKIPCFTYWSTSRDLGSVVEKLGFKCSNPTTMSNIFMNDNENI